MSMPMIHARPLDDARKGNFDAPTACGRAMGWTIEGRAMCFECQIVRGEMTRAEADEWERKGVEWVKGMIADGELEKPDAYGRMRVTRKGMKNLF